MKYLAILLFICIITSCHWEKPVFFQVIHAKTEGPSSESDDSYSDSNNKLCYTYQVICFIFLWVVFPIAAFFGGIVCNVFAPTPTWQRILAVPGVLWAYYLFFYGGALSLNRTPVDSRVWNFPAYFLVTIIFVTLIFVLPNKKLSRERFSRRLK